MGAAEEKKKISDRSANCRQWESGALHEQVQLGAAALTAEAASQMVIAALLAAAGGGAGMLAYLWLVRHSEETGYAKAPNRAVKRDEILGESV